MKDDAVFARFSNVIRSHSENPDSSPVDNGVKPNEVNNFSVDKEISDGNNLPVDTKEVI